MDSDVEVYEAARARHPRRWSGEIRDWSLPAERVAQPGKHGQPTGSGRVMESVTTSLKTAATVQLVGSTSLNMFYSHITDPGWHLLPMYLVL